jgi:hypothetical protein
MSRIRHQKSSYNGKKNQIFFHNYQRLVKTSTYLFIHIWEAADLRKKTVLLTKYTVIYSCPVSTYSVEMKEDDELPGLDLEWLKTLAPPSLFRINPGVRHFECDHVCDNDLYKPWVPPSTQPNLQSSSSSFISTL